MNFQKNNIDFQLYIIYVSPPMFLLHVLLLTEDKLFLHGSSTTTNDDAVIMLECEIMHEYLQKYKPLRILESIVLRQTCEIDFIVKKHMKCYGIDNVRGGSYTAFELTNDEKKFIQREHLMTIDKMEAKCNAMATVFNEYKDIRTWSLDKINTEMSLVTRQQSLYDSEKTMFVAHAPDAEEWRVIWQRCICRGGLLLGEGQVARHEDRVRRGRRCGKL